MKDLGWVNGWNGNPPQEYTLHKKLSEGYTPEALEHRKHTTIRETGKCVCTIVCHTCQITWKVDSSD